jgi:hypothetical protein
MQCKSCKAELTPEARTCPACGAPTHYGEEAEPGSYSEQVSYIDTDATGPVYQSSGSDSSRPTPISDQASASEKGQQTLAQGELPNYANAGQPTSVPQQPLYPGIQPGYLPNQPGYPPYPGYYQGGGQPFPPQPGYPPNPAYYQGQSSYPMAAPQGNMFQPGSQRQSHFARNLVISLVSVLVVVLLVIVGILLFLLNQSRTASTSSSNTIASSPITTNDPQALYRQVMSRQPTVNDPLSVQSQTNWQTLNQGSQESCTFNSGALHAKSPQGPLLGCLDTSDTYNNFAIQVQVAIIQGDAAGLAFRADPVRGYVFAISPQSSYSLITVQDNTSNPTSGIKLLTAGISQAINAGYNKSNQITIIARNSSIYLYINSQYLTTINDSTSSAGMIGAIAVTKSSPADAAFSNLKIWKL